MYSYICVIHNNTDTVNIINQCSGNHSLCFQNYQQNIRYLIFNKNIKYFCVLYSLSCLYTLVFSELFGLSPFIMEPRFFLGVRYFFLKNWYLLCILLRFCFWNMDLKHKRDYRWSKNLTLHFLLLFHFINFISKIGT